MAHENDQQLHTAACNDDDVLSETDKSSATETLKQSSPTNANGNVTTTSATTAASQQAEENETSNNGTESVPAATTNTHKEKLNDLVADICINGHRSHIAARVRTPPGFEHLHLSSSSDLNLQKPHLVVADGVAAVASAPAEKQTSPATNSNVPPHNVQQPQTQPQPSTTQNSSFSFKHFLSSSNVLTAPSTTVTSLDPPSGANIHNNSNTSTLASFNSRQTSTGARPKVPQSNSVTSTSISSLIGGGGGGGSGGLGITNSNEVGSSTSAATKMKRSPRFSSFDSQASLAEYAGTSDIADLMSTNEASSSNMRISTTGGDYHHYGSDIDQDAFAEGRFFSTNAATMTTNSSDYDRGQYVPRSFSNYEMPRPQTSPRRRVGIGGTAAAGSSKDNRPTRLTLNKPTTNATTAAKLKLDLPLNKSSAGGGVSSTTNAGAARKNATSRPNDFVNSIGCGNNPQGAAALPDFVQDHWLDSAWYAANSPSSSPIKIFPDDLPCGERASGGAGHNNSNINNIRPHNIDAVPLPGPADIQSVGGGNGLPEPPSSSSVGSKMLPDFLSDGPIIHSSQRLADVAAGLPSNSTGSPDDSNISTQLSRLRSDNERLQRELMETRSALNEQTLRANHLERQLAEQQQLQHKQQLKLQNDCESQVLKLRLNKLLTEMDALKRENELMREEGAVGGYVPPNCERSTYAARKPGVTTATTTTTTASTTEQPSTIGSAAANVAGVRTNRRPSSRIQQNLSRDLRSAALNAEQNLKQLLAGVENLRQMAANIEKSEQPLVAAEEYDDSPDLFSDFLEECDDYEEYPGGPAL